MLHKAREARRGRLHEFDQESEKIARSAPQPQERGPRHLGL